MPTPASRQSGRKHSALTHATFGYVGQQLELQLQYAFLLFYRLRLSCNSLLGLLHQRRVASYRAGNYQRQHEEEKHER